MDGSVDGVTLGSGQWNGYGVIQAKYKLRDSGNKKNAEWVISAIKAELNEWVKPNTKRKPVPDYYVVVTNVLLTPTAEVGGIDTVDNALADCAKTLRLDIKKFAIWHYDQIRTLLDDAVDIRTTYAAWITPGDVLAQLMADRAGLQPRRHPGRPPAHPGRLQPRRENRHHPARRHHPAHHRPARRADHRPARHQRQDQQVQGLPNANPPPRVTSLPRSVLPAPGILQPRQDHRQERSLRSRPSDGAPRHS
jgi:hypothetical protein